MKISVIVPTYKPQAYLWECLDSIYNQTFPKTDYELILVLNGCCEPYNTQIKEWFSKHSDLQMQYFQTDEGGVSNARNIALDNFKGEYVTFIDDDDLISPEYLKELYDKAAPDTVSLCYPYAFQENEISKQLNYTVTDAYDYAVKKQCSTISSKVRKYFSGPCMKLIPMSFIQGKRYDKRFKIGEDSLFMFLISDKIHKVSFTSRNAIYYRRYRVESASFKKRSAKEQITNNMKLIWEYIKIYANGGYSSYIFVTRIASRIREIMLYPIAAFKKKVEVI